MATGETCATGFMSTIIAAQSCVVMQTGRSGAVYNIGARNERRNIEVVESLLDTIGKPRSLIRFVKDRPGHDRRYAIDPTLIETELGWRPAETWESGLQKTIEWYQDNGLLAGTNSKRRVSGLLPGTIWSGGQRKLKVLVTGAGGMVGRAVVEYCRSQGDSVFAFDHQGLDIGDPDRVMQDNRTRSA